MSKYEDPITRLIIFLKLLNIYLGNIKIYYLKYHYNKKLDINTQYKIKSGSNLINIESIIKLYNKTIKYLEIYVNLFIKIYKEKLNWKINFAVFRTIELNNYNFILDYELYYVIRQLKNNIFDIFEKSIYITTFVPKLESAHNIEMKILHNLKKKYKL